MIKQNCIILTVTLLWLASCKQQQQLTNHEKYSYAFYKKIANQTQNTWKLSANKDSTYVICLKKSDTYDGSIPKSDIFIVNLNHKKIVCTFEKIYTSAFWVSNTCICYETLLGVNAGHQPSKGLMENRKRIYLDIVTGKSCNNINEF